MSSFKLQNTRIILTNWSKFRGAWPGRSGLDDSPCEEKLRGQDFFSLEMRWSWQRADSSLLKAVEETASLEQGRRKRIFENYLNNLNLDKFRVNMRKNNSTVRTVRHLNSPLTEAVMSQSLKFFIIWLDKALGKLVWFYKWALFQQEDESKIPCSYSIIFSDVENSFCRNCK